jgi:O-antigen/teichoic acid export membrane protein
MNLRRSIILSALGQYGRQVIMFGASVVVARLLTPAEMGVFAVSMGVIGLLGALRTMGIPAYFVSLPTISTEDLRLYAGLSWLLGLGFAALLVAISWWASAFYANPQVGTSLRILAVAQGLSPIGVVPGLLLMREMRFGAMLWVGLAAGAIQAVTVISLAATGSGPLSLAWAQVASNLTSSFGTMLCVPALVGLRPSLRGWRRPIGFGGWLTATSISSNVGMQAAELITGRVLGLASTALYSRALGLANLIQTLFYATATQPALPAFVQAEREETGGMGRVYLRFVAVITGLSWPAYAALAIWAEPITVLLYGDQWRPAAALVPMICLASILIFAAMPYHEVLVARQRVRLFFLCETGLLLNWLALLLVATRLGLQAVAWAYVANSLIALIVYIAAMRRAIGLRLRDLAAVWWRSGVPALVVAAVAALVRLSPIATAWPLPLVLVLTGCLGGLAWFAAIWLVRHEFRDHAVELLRWGWAKLQSARL